MRNRKIGYFPTFYETVKTAILLFNLLLAQEIFCITLKAFAAKAFRRMNCDSIFLDLFGTGSFGLGFSQL
jgi:hypothetical protein